MDEAGENAVVGLTSDIAEELFHVRPVSVANTADVELISKSVETKFEPEKRKATPPSEPTSSPSSEPEESVPSESTVEESEHDPEPEPEPEPEEEEDEEEKSETEPESEPTPESESEPVLDLPGYSSVTVADSLAILDTFSEVKWMMEEIAENFEKVAGRQGHVHRRAAHPIHVITTRHPMITSAINQLENSILGFGDEMEALQNRTPTEISSEPTPEPVPANPALIETLDLLQETIYTIQTRKAERASKKKAKAAETLKALTDISKSLQILEGKEKFSEAVQADPVSAITSIWSTGKGSALSRGPQDSAATSVQSVESAIFPNNTPPAPGSMLFRESTISSKEADAEEFARTTEHHNKSKGRSSSKDSGKKSEKSEDSPSLLKKITSKLFGKSKDSSEQDDKSNSKKDKASSKTSPHKKSTSAKTSEGRKPSPTKDSMVIRDSKSSKKSKKDKRHSTSSNLSTDKSHHHKRHHKESKNKTADEKDPVQLAAERRANNQEKLACLMNMLRSCHWVDGRIDQMWQKLNGPSAPMGMGGCSQPMNQPMCQQPFMSSGPGMMQTGPGAMSPGPGMMPPGPGTVPQSPSMMSPGAPMMFPGTSPMAGPYQRQQPPMSQFPMLPPPMMSMPPVVPMPFPWFPFMPCMPPPPNYIAVQKPCQGGSSGATFFCTRID
uniref:Uncharacterized protein n=1 Tax=Schistocephalus solidus TaxID=70667 RepID=A0A0X3P5R3_SCHSO